jgi:hypothetical protein
VLSADISVQRQFEKILDADETMSITHRVSQRVVVDDHMAELAGDSACAAEHLTVDPERHFREGAEIGVITHQIVLAMSSPASTQGSPLRWGEA